MTDFITTWQTTVDTETITLPLVNGGTYNFVADWGDLGPTSEITAWDDADKTHAYAVAGTYTVTITGVITGWAFNNLGDKTKIKEVIQWGSLAFGAGSISAGAFYGCSALTVSALDAPDLTGTTSCRSYFRGCAALTTIWNVNWVFPSAADFTYFLDSAVSYNQAFQVGLFPEGVDFTYFLVNATSYDKAFPAGLFPKGIIFFAFLWLATSYDKAFPAGLFPKGNNFQSLLQVCSTYNQIFPPGLFPLGTNFIGLLYQTILYNKPFPRGLFPNGANFTSFMTDVTINKQYYSALLLDLYHYGKTGLTFHGGGSKYYRGWPTWIRAGFVAQGNTITADGGQEGVISSGMAMMGHC